MQALTVNTPIIFAFSLAVTVNRVSPLNQYIVNAFDSFIEVFFQSTLKKGIAENWGITTKTLLKLATEKNESDCEKDP